MYSRWKAAASVPGPYLNGTLVVPLACVSALALAGICAVARAAPGNVLLARDRTEPIVAVDPTHPSLIVAGSNTNYDAPVGDTFPVAYFTSHDGGKTFSSGNVPVLRPYTTGADPTVAIARSGTVFYSYLAETPTYCSQGGAAVLLARSFDGARSFSSLRMVDSNPDDDKPNMAVESVPGRHAHVFVVWTRGHSHGSDIWYARSSDGGASFSRPTMLYSSRLDNLGAVPVVGPHGRVYVFWSEFPDSRPSAPARTQIDLRVSNDDGIRFQPMRRAVGPFYSVPAMAQPGSLRTLTQPALAVTATGVLYLAWSAATHQHRDASVDADILLSRSGDGGRSWSKPVRVNDSTHLDRFMPSISTLPDQSVGIVFYDRRESGAQLDLYAARARFDGHFRLSRNLRITQGISSISDIFYIKPGSTCFSPGRFFGDYIGSSACGRGTMCVTWSDAQLHVYQRTDVWFAKVALPSVPIPRPSDRARFIVSRKRGVLHNGSWQ